MRLGERSGERRATEAAQQQSSASGGIGTFLILIAILACGHVDLRSSHPPVRATSHAVISR
jgi:hypothetical protein